MKRKTMNFIVSVVLLALLSCNPEAKPVSPKDTGIKINGTIATVTNSEGLKSALENNSLTEINLKSATYDDSYTVSSPNVKLQGEAGVKVTQLTANADKIQVVNLSARNLIAGSGINDGELTLNNVTVEESAVIKGGGSGQTRSSTGGIKILGSTIFNGELTVDKEDVMLALDETVQVNKAVVILQPAKLEPTGANPPKITGDVVVNYTNSSDKPTTINVKTETLLVTQTVGAVNIGANAQITSLITVNVNITIQNNGAITKSNADIAGAAKIQLDDKHIALIGEYSLLPSLMKTTVNNVTADFKVDSSISVGETVIPLRWESLDTALVYDEAGKRFKVTRPADGKDKTAKIKVSFTHAGETKSREFTLTIKASLPDSDIDLFLGNISNSFILLDDNFGTSELGKNYMSNLESANLTVSSDGFRLIYKVSKQTTGGYSVFVEANLNAYKVNDLQIDGILTGNISLADIEFILDEAAENSSTSVFTGRGEFSAEYIKDGTITTKSITAEDIKFSTSEENPEGSITYENKTYDISLEDDRNALTELFIPSEEDDDSINFDTILIDIIKSATGSYDFALSPESDIEKELTLPLLETLLPASTININADISLKGWISGSTKITFNTSKKGDDVECEISIEMKDYKNIDEVDLNTSDFKISISEQVNLKSLINDFFKPMMLDENLEPNAIVSDLKIFYAGSINGTIKCTGSTPGELKFENFTMKGSSAFPPSFDDESLPFDSFSGTVSIAGKTFTPEELMEYISESMTYFEEWETEMSADSFKVQSKLFNKTL